MDGCSLYASVRSNAGFTVATEAEVCLHTSKNSPSHSSFMGLLSAPADAVTLFRITDLCGVMFAMFALLFHSLLFTLCCLSLLLLLLYPVGFHQEGSSL